MKKDLHPDYKVCQVSCACGNSFETKSVTETLRVDICSKCHPFFTGEQKLVDAAGRVEKLKAKYNMAKSFIAMLRLVPTPIGNLEKI